MAGFLAPVLQDNWECKRGNARSSPSWTKEDWEYYMKDWLKNVKEQLGETQKTWGWTKAKAGKKRSGNQAKRESWYNKKRFDKLSQKRARQAADALQRKDKETWEKEVSTQTPRTVATQTDLTDPWPESQPDQPDNVAYSPTVTGLEEVEVTIVPKEPMGPNDLHLVEKEHVETEENLRMVATAVEAAQRGTMALIQRLLPIDPKNNDAMNAQMVFLSDCAQAALTADDYLSAVASLVKVNQLPWWAPIGQKGGGRSAQHSYGGLLLCLLGQEQATKTKNNICLNSCVLRMILGLCSWESGLHACLFVSHT